MEDLEFILCALFDSRHFSFCWFSEPFSRDFSFIILEWFPCGLIWGDHTWVPRDSFLGDLWPSNSGKCSEFEVVWLNPRWRCSWLWFSIAHDLVSLGTWSTRSSSPMRWSIYPQSFTSIRWANREIGWFEIKGWPAVWVLLEAPRQMRSNRPCTPVRPPPYSKLDFRGVLLLASSGFTEKLRVKSSS